MMQTAHQTRLNSTPPALVAYNPQALSSLNRAIAFSVGEPGFLLAHCENLHLRRDIIQEVLANPALQVEVLTLHPSVTQLFSTLEGALSQPHPDVVMILGLESVVDLEAFWSAANLMREQFKSAFPFPLVFWVNDRVLRQLRRVAPDFANQAPPALRMEGIVDLRVGVGRMSRVSLSL